MAVAFVKNHTVGSNKTAATTTVDLVLDTDVPAGNLIVARILYDNAATSGKPVVSSIARAAGETVTWSFGVRQGSVSTTAGAFVSGEMWRIRTAVVWPAGTYTVTLDTATTQKAGFFQEFSGALSTTRSISGQSYSTTTTAASATTADPLPVIGDLAIGFIYGSNVAAAQAGDTDTTGGSWSAVAGVGTTGGSAATNNYGVGQYKILTAASHQTLNNSAAMTAGNGSLVMILRPYVPPAVTQAAFRFYADGTETGSVALAAQDTAPTVDISSGDVNLQLRVRLQSTSAVVVPNTDDWQLQWERNASGTWVNVGGSTVVGFDSANLTDGAATTNRLGAGSGAFFAGKVSETGLVSNLGWSSNQYVEALYSVTLKQADLAPTDTVRFRVLNNGATDVMTFTAVPSVTIGAAAPTDVTGTATGFLALAGAAAGQKDVTATATGSLTLAGAAAGAPTAAPVTGAATGTLAVTGAASGIRAMSGAATGTLDLAAVAVGVHGVTATAAGAVTVVAAATGAKTVTATATGTLTLAGTSSGARGGAATATGTLAVTATASGLRATTATATGSLVLAGAAAGLRVATGTATGALELAGTASGLHGVAATATGALAIAGVAVGARTATATATGTLSITSSALGQISGAAVGNATGIVTVAGAATGRRGTTGSGAGTLAMTGLAGGQRTAAATATGTLAITGTATGLRAVTAVAAGSISIVGVAVATGTAFVGATVNVWDGSTFVDADVNVWTGTGFVDAVAVWVWDGTAWVNTGTPTVTGAVTGAATGAVTIAATATGLHGVTATATATIAIAATAAGLHGVTATATGAVTVIGAAVGTATSPAGVEFTGGDSTVDVGGYRVHTFLSSGTLTKVGGDGEVEVFVVGGGGGGGAMSGGGEFAGGGGAGAVRTGTFTVIANVTVTVGGGGAIDTNGTDSSFGAFLTAAGGGRGGRIGALPGASGGSGGGGAVSNSSFGAGGSGGTGGNNGGTATGPGAGSATRRAGGGGGAGAAGTAGVASGQVGNGGIGVTNAWDGSSSYYGGGGGGASGQLTAVGRAVGGLGGGGQGGVDVTGQKDGGNGVANTGGGGGGRAESASGGAGGSGVVIARYVYSDEPNPPLFGTSVNYSTMTMTAADEWARHLSMVGQPDILRVFCIENDGAWTFGNSDGWMDEDNADNTWMSFKFGNDPTVSLSTIGAAITTSIGTYPATGRHWVTYYHEPEDNIAGGDFTWAQWIDRQLEFAGYVHAAGKSNVYVAPILSGKFRVVDTDPGTDPGNLANLITAATSAGKLDDLQAAWDCIGFDQYNKGTIDPAGDTPNTSQMTAGYWFDDFVDWVDTNFPGLQVGLAETGFCSSLTQTGGTAMKRTWLQNVHDYAVAHGWFACCYYDAAAVNVWYLTWLNTPAPDDPADPADAATGALWGSFYDT